MQLAGKKNDKTHAVEQVIAHEGTVKKLQKFDVVAAVKSNSRDVVGFVRSSFVIRSKHLRPARYKKNYLREAAE